MLILGDYEDWPVAARIKVVLEIGATFNIDVQ